MKRLQHFVNLLFSRFTLHLHAVFCEGANYSQRWAPWQEHFHDTAHPLFLASCRTGMAQSSAGRYSCFIKYRQ